MESDVAIGRGDGPEAKYLAVPELLDDCIRPLEPHPNWARQQDWERDEIETLRAFLTRV